ncbi:uncharacterized protein LOC129926232 [Biomphalaria glabrata]|uniref:Uncharacterized protein LOC129926232 n=1 Tax=Biomphalaria glabrata TaxID=6526 RepID=A0A9W3ABV8_BIOGL|nr:uncharacterized protein LOC129926232 [Biomphalaria glabrata]
MIQCKLRETSLVFLSSRRMLTEIISEHVSPEMIYTIYFLTLIVALILVIFMRYLWLLCYTKTEEVQLTCRKKTARVAPILTPLPIDFRFFKYSYEIYESQTEVMQSSSAIVIHYFQHVLYMCNWSSVRKIWRLMKSICLRSGNDMDILKDPKSVIGSDVEMRCNDELDAFGKVLHLFNIDAVQIPIVHVPD